jgi:general secretion pathway protein B
MTLPPAPAAPPSQTLTRTTAAATPTSQIPQAPAPPISPTSPTPADRPPITLSEIPRNLLAELPRLTISAHAYSDKPGAGFVYLSDHLLHEGDTLPVGLKLEQITPDGAILSYKGYRFRLGLQP